MWYDDMHAGAHVLVLGGCGSGLLALLAARAGASRVTCVDRCQLAHHVTRVTLEANSHVPGPERIQVRGLAAVAAAVDHKSINSGLVPLGTACVDCSQTESLWHEFDFQLET